MIGGTKAREPPKRAGQRAILESLTLAPPGIPELTQISVRSASGAGQLFRQQPGHAQHSRLQSGRAGFRSLWTEPGAQFAQTLHRPKVLLVAQRAEQSFP